MRRAAFFGSILLLALGLSAVNGVSQERGEDSVEADTVEAETEEEEKEEKEKPFAELIEDMTVVEGLFTFYLDEADGKVFMEIKPDQLETVFLCSITREAADGHYFSSAAVMQEFPFIFRRVAKKILFIQKNVLFRADEGAAISGALARGVSNSIMGSAKVESQPHPERGSILVDPADFFIQDIGMVSYIFRERIKDVTYDFDKENSYFGFLKSFPKNSEIEVILHFKSSNPQPFPTIPDSRSFQHVYRYGLSTIEETDYQPRIADDRVGHFVTMYQDYTSVLRESPYNRYIMRWHLKKAHPQFGVSRPVEPITFWLENSIPVEYREAVKEGVLLWNDAFERIGFSDAIVVQQQPDDADWDPADVRYNTIRWFLLPGTGLATGSCRANPFTGQIYDADIRVSADFVRAFFREREEFVSPVAVGDSIAASLGILADGSQGRCDYSIGAADQASFCWNLLSARALAGQEVSEEEYIHDALVDLIVHEVGHVLGLRHNFKASTLHPPDQLQDEELTRKEGLTSSVMDYNPVNIAPEGQKQGEYFHSSLGPYDYWAIEYAYKPIDADSREEEAAALDKIAARGTDPRLAYGTDEDALGAGRSVDPSCNRWDLSSDPIAYYQNRIALARELWSKMEGQFEKSGNRYQKLRRVFRQGIAEYRYSVRNVAKFLGGIYYRRDHVGDPDGHIPFEPVPTSIQRAALEFLEENIFGPKAFDFSPDLLDKLAPERFNDFSGSVYKIDRLDYPVHDAILSIQERALEEVYLPIRLSRMQDLELRPKRRPDSFTMAEMFAHVRGAIWSEIPQRTNISSFRRALQRTHLARLIQLVLKPAKGTPKDASTLARADLVELKRSIEEASLNESLDAYTAAHLAETLAQIETALSAGVHRQLGLPPE